MKSDSGRYVTRERGILILYEADIKGITTSDVVNSIQVKVPDYLIRVLEFFEANKKSVDFLIEKNLIGWTLNRINYVDRAILRFATSELMMKSEEVPKGVILAEAVKLADELATEDSGRFVNGVLGAIAKDLGYG